MKKIFSLLAVAVCCFFLATPAQAQLLKWGVQGGLNLAEWSGRALEIEKTIYTKAENTRHV